MCTFLLIIIVFCQLRMRSETSSDEEKDQFILKKLYKVSFKFYY